MFTELISSELQSPQNMQQGQQCLLNTDVAQNMNVALKVVPDKKPQNAQSGVLDMVTGKYPYLYWTQILFSYNVTAANCSTNPKKLAPYGTDGRLLLTAYYKVVWHKN